MADLGKILARAKVVRKESGIRAVIKSAWRYILLPVYAHEKFDLYAYEIKNDQSLDERLSNPPIDHISYKMVSSFEDIDKLEKEGYILSDSAYWGRRQRIYTKRISHGAEAWCSFIGVELATILWIIHSKKIQENVQTSKIKVDYSKGEVLAAGAWTLPKYRRLAFFNYNLRNFMGLLAERGIKKIIVPVNQSFKTTHKTSYNLMKVIGGRKYGVGDYCRIFRHTSWKETYNA